MNDLKNIYFVDLINTIYLYFNNKINFGIIFNILHNTLFKKYNLFIIYQLPYIAINIQ